MENFKDKLSDLKEKAIGPAVVISALTALGLMTASTAYSNRGRLIAEVEHKIAETRQNTGGIIKSNFNTVEKPKQNKIPTLVEYVSAPLPRILNNPDAQTALSICEETRHECASVAQGKIPAPKNSFMSKMFPFHLTGEVRDSVVKVRNCEKDLQNCVLNKVLPHRKQSR